MDFATSVSGKKKDVMLVRKREAGAESCFREVYERRTKLFDPDNEATRDAIRVLIIALEGQGKNEECEVFQNCW